MSFDSSAETLAKAEFVDQLAAIAWRKSRVIATETALIQFQLSVQQHEVRRLHLDQVDDEHQAKFELCLASQALSRKTNPTVIEDPTIPPGGLDVGSIEPARRYQITLDRQYQNVMLSFFQYRKDFAQTQARAQKALGPNEPKCQPELRRRIETRVQTMPKPNEPKR